MDKIFELIKNEEKRQAETLTMRSHVGRGEAVLSCNR